MYRCLGAAIVLAGVSIGYSQTTYNLANSFNTATNPTGLFAYGSKTRYTSDLTPFASTINSGGFQGWGDSTSINGPAIVKNTSGGSASIGSASFTSGSLVLLPGVNMAAYRFVAPTTGVYSLSGTFNYVPTATGTDGAVVTIRTTTGATNATVFSDVTLTATGPTEAAFNVTTASLDAGSYIDFIATKNVSKAGDAVRLAGTITTPVPEPASLCALGLGALAFLRRRRSK